MQRYTVVMAAAAWLAACGGGGEGPATGEASVRDSAGIQVVENTGPVHAAGEAWVVADSPSVSIGGQAQDPVYDLGRVVGAMGLPDGGIAVANAASNEVRFYEASGAHRQTVGRTGDGPGEFQIMAGMWQGPADSLYVLDVAVRRLTVLGPDGGVGHSFALGGMGGAMLPGADGSISLAVPAGVLSDGSLVGMANTFRINDPRAGTFRDTLPLVRYAPNGAVRDTVARVPGMEMEMMTLNFAGQTVATPTQVALGKVTVATAAGDRLYVATNDAWEVQERAADGRLLRLVRVRAEPRAVTEADVATHREEQLELVEAQPGMSMAPAELKEQIRTRINTVPYPDALPFVGIILVDDAGFLWVQEVPRPGEERHRWGVFDRDGRLQAWVRMPARFRPTHVQADRLVGVWQDADDVEHVRTYALTRP